METRREYRRIKFGRKLDVKRLRSLLARTMRETSKNPVSEEAPVRLESVFIEQKATTVYLSGNEVGLDAVAAALRSGKADARTSKVSRDDARQIPRALSRKQRSKSSG
jgi:hypothetical protein